MSALATTHAASHPERDRSHGAEIEVVIPVHNEEPVLERSVRRLHHFLATSMPFDWRIVIADNASTDRTWEVAQRLRCDLDSVEAIRLDEKGRGRALRAAWLASNADVLCYMDVDLSTDLGALLPLIAGLVSGHSDVAIGTRLAPGARVVRSRKRELISRAYNQLLHAVLRSRFSDAQCGFKAIRRDVARRLLGEVQDTGWFFDTELLIAAQRRRLRIHEVAVDWVEDPDSRVDVLRTALDDLRGMLRLLLQPRAARFILVGALSTVAYALLYLMLRTLLAPPVANAIALACTAVANTQANRLYTFAVRGRTGLFRHHLAGAAIYFLALALTNGALDVLRALTPRPSHLLEVVVLVSASAFATISRYVALRSWLFAPARRPRPTFQPGESG